MQLISHVCFPVYAVHCLNSLADVVCSSPDGGVLDPL